MTKTSVDSMNKYLANVGVEIPDNYFEKWQKTVDLMAHVFDVPAGLIMRIFPTEIEVFVSSQTDSNPYEKEEKADLNTGLYCETVMATRDQLEVPNALEDLAWQDNPDVKLNMISYLGVPITWPNDEIFGTICVLDSKTRHYSKLYQSLLWQFKEIVDNDLKLLVNEEQLEQRADELSKALSDLKATQDELVQSEKMAALGHLVAGIAHEINTPLGAISSAVGHISDFFDNNLKQLPEFFKGLSKEREADFFFLMEHISEPKSTLSRREKRQLKKDLTKWLEEENIIAADEVADHLVSIGVQQAMPELLPLLRASERDTVLNMVYLLITARNGTHSINTASDRAAKTIFALKNYTRFDNSGEKTKANLAESVETVLTLYQNYLRQGIEVNRDYQDIPAINCYPDALNQVWTNLIHNALQAMEYKGNLHIAIKQSDNNILVSIADNGKGIDDAILAKIFDPFFTTKPAGEGSGLGLDIVKKIIDKHEGDIKVSSQPGETIFTIILPIE